MNKSIKFTICLLAVLFSSLASAKDLTYHQIIVPPNHSYGRNQEAFKGTSQIERYIEAYERTWWKVMNAFVSGSSDWKRHDDFICSGTPAEAEACIKAYNDAYQRINELLKDMDVDVLKKN